MVRGDTQTLEMRGSWSRGVVLRWILLLLIQSASQEREEAMQKLALKAVLRVIDSVQSEEASLLEEVEERCALEHLGIDSVKEAEPLFRFVDVSFRGRRSNRIRCFFVC